MSDIAVFLVQDFCDLLVLFFTVGQAQVLAVVRPLKWVSSESLVLLAVVHLLQRRWVAFASETAAADIRAARLLQRKQHSGNRASDDRNEPAELIDREGFHS